VRIVAENLRRLRDERGVSIDELVRRCTAGGNKLHRNTIINIENVKVPSIRTDTIEMLAAGLGVELDDLVLRHRPAEEQVGFDEFLASGLADDASEEERELLRKAKFPWGPPTLKGWLKALETMRATRAH
jgi:transcriptional regulator with XRE-family HTH domain